MSSSLPSRRLPGAPASSRALCPPPARAKPPPAAPAPADDRLGGGVGSLLYGAASRIERGSATCLSCKGTGACSCPDCHVREERDGR